MLLVLTATHSHISLGLALHIMQIKGYILSKVSTALDQVRWVIKPGIFFPFVVIPDTSEKGR